jgi:hypothetical protein
MTIRDQILSVIRDGSRIDRFIESGPNGLFVTTENEAERQVRIGFGDGTTEEQEEKWADELIELAEGKFFGKVTAAPAG